MSEWIRVKDKLPEEPEVKEDCIDCEEIGDCDGYSEYKEYLVTEVCEDGSFLEILVYAGDGKWWDEDGCEIEDGCVVAWRELPEPYEDNTKYRWRFEPKGYGNLRQLYLTATFPVLTLAEWDIPVEKKNYKNIFTESEVGALSDLWKFDTDLFVREEIETPITGQYTIPDEEK